MLLFVILLLLFVRSKTTRLEERSQDLEDSSETWLALNKFHLQCQRLSTKRPRVQLTPLNLPTVKPLCLVGLSKRWSYAEESTNVQ